MIVNRYDFINVKAVVSKEGWIKDRPVVTRSGIFQYRTKDGKITKEYRPDDVVFHTDSLASLAGIPITNDHIGILSAMNYSKGIVGTVLSPGAREDNNVVADIIIHDANKLGDKRDLSLGYTCNLDETPGQTDKGERYDAIQKDITYNHLAIVKSGRAGNARLRLDSNDAVNGTFDQENNMSDSNTPKLPVFRMDNIDYYASQEIINRITKLEADHTALKTKYDSLEAERDTLKVSLDGEKTKRLDDAKTAVSSARSRLNLEDIAAKNNVTITDATSDRDIKMGVVTKLRGDAIKFDGKSDDYVNSAYDLVMIENLDKDKKVGDQRKQMNDRKDSNDTSSDQSSRSARERMLSRIRGEKVEA